MQTTEKPDLYDTLATAVYLAAFELAQVYPQPEGDSVEKWKKYLLQRALLVQQSMTEEERTVFRNRHFT
jgi:hypothetical protein